MITQYRCYICGKTSAIASVCWHTDKDGKEFGVRMRPAVYTPKPLEPDTYVTIPECKT